MRRWSFSSRPPLSQVRSTASCSATPAMCGTTVRFIRWVVRDCRRARFSCWIASWNFISEATRGLCNACRIFTRKITKCQFLSTRKLCVSSATPSGLQCLRPLRFDLMTGWAFRLFSWFYPGGWTRLKSSRPVPLKGQPMCGDTEFSWLCRLSWGGTLMRWRFTYAWGEQVYRWAWNWTLCRIVACC